MSDWIEYDGKKYFEESYLLAANASTRRRRAQLAAAKSDVARLTDERDCALAGARASDDERAQAVESMRKAMAEVERLKGVIARTAEELRDKQHEDDLVVASRDAEIERLKGILRDVVTEAGGLAAPGVSTDFLSYAPAEVRGVIARLRAALRETREALAFVIGDHSVPSDCYSSGPVTGTPLDAICPSCRGMAVLARYAGLAGEVENG